MTTELWRAHFILYVLEQGRSRAFYEAALGIAPSLDVPGMTEFPLPGGAVLGLMPEAGIRRLLGAALEGLPSVKGGPRAELYLVVEEPETAYARALCAGARPLSPVAPRDWGHAAGYCLDPDGHVVAFARELARGG